MIFEKNKDAFEKDAEVFFKKAERLKNIDYSPEKTERSAKICSCLFLRRPVYPIRNNGSNVRV